MHAAEKEATVTIQSEDPRRRSDWLSMRDQTLRPNLVAVQLYAWYKYFAHPLTGLIATSLILIQRAKIIHFKIICSNQTLKINQKKN